MAEKRSVLDVLERELTSRDTKRRVRELLSRTSKVETEMHTNQLDLVCDPVKDEVRISYIYDNPDIENAVIKRAKLAKLLKELDRKKDGRNV